MADGKQEMRINEAQAQEIIDEEIRKLWTVFQQSPLSWDEVTDMTRANVDKWAESYDPDESTVPEGGAHEERRNLDTSGLPTSSLGPAADEIEAADPITPEEARELAKSAAKPVVKEALETEAESGEGTQRANYAGTPTGSSFDPPTGGGGDVNADVPVGGAFDGLFDESSNGDGRGGE